MLSVEAGPGACTLALREARWPVAVVLLGCMGVPEVILSHPVAVVSPGEHLVMMLLLVVFEQLHGLSDLKVCHQNQLEGVFLLGPQEVEYLVVVVVVVVLSPRSWPCRCPCSVLAQALFWNAGCRAASTIMSSRPDRERPFVPGSNLKLLFGETRQLCADVYCSY